MLGVAKKENSELEKLKRRFLEYLEIERGRSLKTVENYDRYLSRFLKYAGSKKASDLTDDSVREFRLWLNRQPSSPTRKLSRTLKRNTQNYHLIALRNFLKYLARCNVKSLSPDRIDLAKTPDRELDLISAQELDRILNGPKLDTDTGRRDKAMLELFFSTGLRVSELCSLDIDSINLARDEFSIRGKGEKVRLVFVSPEAKGAIKDYLAKRKDMNPAMFINFSRRGKDGREAGDERRLTSRSVERIVKIYATKAGVSKKVTPHTLRHSFATDLLQNGADIRSVQMMLGHANVATTQIYTHFTDKQLQDVHKKFHNRKG